MITIDPARELRACAFGNNAREAATELLIQTGLAGPAEPWILYDRQWGFYIIDYDAVSDGRPGLTNSQRAVLLLAASLANNTPVDMQFLTRDLDRDNILFVVSAISRAAGHDHRTPSAASSARHGML